MIVSTAVVTKTEDWRHAKCWEQLCLGRSDPVATYLTMTMKGSNASHRQITNRDKEGRKANLITYEKTEGVAMSACMWT